MYCLLVYCENNIINLWTASPFFSQSCNGDPLVYAASSTDTGASWLSSGQRTPARSAFRHDVVSFHNVCCRLVGRRRIAVGWTGSNSWGVSLRGIRIAPGRVLLHRVARSAEPQCARCGVKTCRAVPADAPYIVAIVGMNHYSCLWLKNAMAKSRRPEARILLALSKTTTTISCSGPCFHAGMISPRLWIGIAAAVLFNILPIITRFIVHLETALGSQLASASCALSRHGVSTRQHWV